jgi:hypothetical protein
VFSITLRAEGAVFSDWVIACEGEHVFEPAPIRINEEFTVRASTLVNGPILGCQSGVNGPEKKPERVVLDLTH